MQKTVNQEPIHALLQRNLWPFGNRAKTNKTTINKKQDETQENRKQEKPDCKIFQAV